MNSQLAKLIGDHIELQDIRKIIKERGYFETEFNCSKDGYNITITRNDRVRQYVEPNHNNSNLAIALTWINDFMNDLESGQFD